MASKYYFYKDEANKTEAISSKSINIDEIAQKIIDKGTQLSKDDIVNIIHETSIQIKSLVDEGYRVNFNNLDKIKPHIKEHQIKSSNSHTESYENKISDSLNKYHEIYENAPDMFACIDLETTCIIDCNFRLVEKTGYTKDELIGMSIFEIYHPDCLTTAEELFNIFTETGKIENARLQLKHKNGNKLHVSLNSSAIYDNNGKILYRISIWRDMTFFARMEESMRKTSNHLNAILMSAKDGILSISSDNIILSCNRACQGIFGYSENELIGKPVQILYPSSDDFINISKDVIESLKNKNYFFGQSLAKRKNGEIFPTDFSISILNENDNNIGFVAVVRDITEQRLAEENLKELSIAVHQTADPILITKKCGVIEYVNPAVERLTGYSKHEIIGNTPKIFKSGKHNSEFYKDLWDTILSGRVFRAVFINSKKNGELYYENRSITPVTDKSGNIINFISTGRDITEQKKANEELLKAKSLIDNTFLALNDAVLLVDIKTKQIIKCNLAIERVFGYSINEVTGKNTELLHISSETCDEFRKQLLSTLQHSGTLNIEYDMKRKDGTIFPTEISIAKVLDNTGDYIAVVAVIRDITERKQFENEIRSMASFAQVNPSPVLRFDKNGKLLLANPGAKKIFNLTSEQDVYIENLLPNFKILEKNINNIITNSETFEFSDIVNERLFHFTLIGLPDLDVLHAYGNDTTEYTKTVAEKEKMHKQLIQSQKLEAIGILARGVAHDFNNVLTSIIGGSSQLMAMVDKSSHEYDYVKKIHFAGERAADITRQLLLFSRKQPLKMMPINLNNHIDSLTDMLKRIIGEHIAINKQLDPNLMYITADSASIDQVIMNITVNSRNALMRGGTISYKTKNIELKKSDDALNAPIGIFVCLTIKDNGCGMNKEIMSRIFEPLFTTSESGSGLGLSVVQNVIKQCNGWIDVESKENIGTTFNIYFPAYESKVLEISKNEILLSDIKGNGERILLVEDDKSVREFLKVVLKDNNYIVIVTSTVKQAIEVFVHEKGNFDILFTDVFLTDSTGIMLAEKLKFLNPELKVVLTSGYFDNKTELSIIENRGYHFLNKPCDLIQLLKLIKKVLTD
ncbi:MAG: PAS domain S-box protein [Spirochaetota bacterium]|nr:PAS domain S-box protein [Spirochaetota bacterium]